MLRILKISKAGKPALSTRHKIQNKQTNLFKISDNKHIIISIYVYIFVLQVIMCYVL